VSSDSAGGGVMTGRIVDSDSGNRRVRNNVDACLYIFEICEEACLEEDPEFEREEMLEESNWDEDRVSRVGASVVAMEPLDAIVGSSSKVPDT
jgi:hypothetical protein